MIHPAAVDGRRQDIDQASRERIARWLIYFWHLHEDQEFKSQQEYADFLKLSLPTINLAVNGRRVAAGLEVLLSLREAFKISAERMLSFDPPKYAPGTRPPPLDLPSPNPSTAAPSVRPGRRKGGG